MLPQGQHVCCKVVVSRRNIIRDQKPWLSEQPSGPDIKKRTNERCMQQKQNVLFSSHEELSTLTSSVAFKSLSSLYTRHLHYTLVSLEVNTAPPWIRDCQFVTWRTGNKGMGRVLPCRWLMERRWSRSSVLKCWESAYRNQLDKQGCIHYVPKSLVLVQSNTWAIPCALSDHVYNTN